MTQHSHQTAPTQFVDAAGVQFAYRRFGRSGGVPLVFNMHFIGTMDHWDPLVLRRLVLVGTGPRGGQNMATLTPEGQQIFGATYKVPEEIWLKVHFTDSEASQAAGREFLKRFLRRTENRDPEVNEKVAPAQIEAIGKWGVQREGSYEYLKTIRQPALVINGDNDVII
jgi:pimeloyl-ACP methyl ester carboxylesterase